MLPVLSLESKLEVQRDGDVVGARGLCSLVKPKNQKNKTPSQLGET